MNIIIRKYKAWVKKTDQSFQNIWLPVSFSPGRLLMLDST